MHLSVHDLTKLYGQQRGLLPISFEAEQGESIAVVGHNGAGKSTLLKILANWVLPDSGEALIDGIPIRDRIGIVGKVGFIPEEPNLFDLFSVEYNLRLFAALFRTPPDRVDELLREFDLGPFRTTTVRVLSKGLKQRVSIGRALLPRPSVLLFDEPTSGLDFEMTREIHRLLKQMHESGKTVVFTSHRPEEIRRLATRIMVLHKGSLVFDGTPQAYFKSDVHGNLYA